MVLAPAPTQILDGRLAAGLLWRPLVSGGSVADLALARAKDERARMYAHDGKTPVVGLAHLGKMPKGQVHAIASMAARAFPAGDSVFALRIGEVWWVGASSNGTPVHDQVIADPTEVWPLVDELQAKRKSPTVRADPELALSEFEELHVDELEQLKTSEALLRQVATRLHPAVYLVALALVGYAGYVMLWPKYSARYLRHAAPPAAPPVDAVAEWTAAQAAWTKTISAAMGQDLEPVKQALFKVPLDVGGWSLTETSCVLGHSWQCTAKYRRPTRIESESTNQTFDKARPSDWKVAWKGAADASATFEVAGTQRTALVPQTHMVPLAQYQVATYSEFQTLAKAFTKVEVPDMARVDIPAPRDREGKPIPRPGEAVPEIFRASVLLEGPLRNIELAEIIAAPVFWREITARRGKADKVGLYESEFHSTMKGEIYAREK
jgi:hypothetical protein